MRGLYAAAVACLFAFPAYAGDWPNMNSQIDQTNFVVNEGCSGTLIDIKNRYILTASHCVNAQYETVDHEKVADDGTVTTEKIRRLKPGTAQQLLFDGALEVRETSYRTKIVAVDTIRDLALIQIISAIPNSVFSRLSCDTPARGDTVFVVGNPKGALYSSLVKGIVSSLQRTYETLHFGDSGVQQQPLMQVSAGVIGGNSGGAVYDIDGNLIGVPVLAHTQNEILGFAVPLDVIKDFLKDNKLESVYAYCQPSH